MNYYIRLVIIGLLILLSFLVINYSITIGTDYVYGDVQQEIDDYNSSNRIFCSIWSNPSNVPQECANLVKRYENKQRAQAVCFYSVGLIQILLGLFIMSDGAIPVTSSGAIALIYGVALDWNNLTNIHKLGLSLFGLVTIAGVAGKKGYITL